MSDHQIVTERLMGALFGFGGAMLLVLAVLAFT